jgi:sugar lactone lactonase YvrE
MKTPARCIQSLVTIGLCGLAWSGCDALFAADSSALLRVSTLAGSGAYTGDGSVTSAGFSEPGGIAVDRFGNVYVSDTDRDMGLGNTIRKITRDGMVVTLAGASGRVGSRDGPGAVASFFVPEGLAVDDAGAVYVADSHNHSIRKISPDDRVTTLAGGFVFPMGVAVDRSGNVFASDTYRHVIRMITPRGDIQIVAGTVGLPGSKDGIGGAAQFKYPAGIGLDDSGNIYVVDLENATIRKITTAGVVTTIAGTAGSFGSADGSGNAARFGRMNGLAVDRSYNIYVTDTTNHTLRKISPNGTVSTVAGMAGTAGYVDGTGDVARFYFPVGVAVDTAGAVYVADMGNNRVRVMVPLAAPVIENQPTSQTVASGSSVVFTAAVAGTAPATYQWDRDGKTIIGATNSTLVITTATEADAGAYTCIIGNPSGAVTSNAATLTIANAASVSRLVNLSVRSTAGTEEQPLLVGFVVGGAGRSGASNVLVRAAGPALNFFGASGVLSDPVLTVSRGGTVIAANDNWAMPASSRLAVQAAERVAGAFTFSNLLSLDAALVAELPPVIDGYTVRVTGNAPGVTLAELYDVTAEPSTTAARLINVSVRTRLEASADGLIAGFAIGGTTSKTVLIRAIGPGLEQFGVNAALQHPQLALHTTSNGRDVILATNAGWDGQAEISAIGNSVGAFPLTSSPSADAAMLRSLSPGAYTIHVTAARGEAGLVLAEIYEVP